ncbi:MAG: prepilin-type N-terminal cleavage/methylation domain-containing protein [Burkholderiales bacterium]|nr:prepilin-type N-terminal cleavage/methylation domain-containing protein [Burkholderiales bacterium]
MNTRRRAARARGLTLIELMVGLAVLALLITAAAPFMGDLIANSRLRESGNLLFTESLIAQSEAIKRNTVVRVRASDSATIQVHDMSDPSTPLLLRERTLPEGAALPPTMAFEFGAEGRPVPFGTPISVDLSPASGSCSDDLRCPGLRVDAGGAMRLCPNHLANCP